MADILHTKLISYMESVVPFFKCVPKGPVDNEPNYFIFHFKRVRF